MSTLVLNLAFHGVGDPPAAVADSERDYWLSRDAFTDALDAIGRLSGRSTVSFDDGNASDLSIALPELQRRRMRATFFVVADRLGRPGYLDGGDLRVLRGAGMTIGLHGMRHQRWRGLSDFELDQEIETARALLEDEARAPLEAAACPFGAYDRRVLGRLEGAGFDAVFTSDGGWATGGAWLQARNTLRAADDGRAVSAWAADDGVVSRSRHRLKTTVKRWR